MNAKRVFVMVATFFALLLLPGCSDGVIQPGGGTVRERVPIPSLVDQNGDDREDEPLVYEHRPDEFAADSGTMGERTGSVHDQPDETEVPVPGERMDPADRPPVDPGTSWMEPTGRVLPASTCHGRRLALAPEVAGWMRTGYQLWHLCYRTPSPMTSSDRLARERAERVSFGFFDERAHALRGVVTVPAPRTANPWTANVLVILAPPTRPFFSIENDYASGQRLGAVSEVRPNDDILTHGTVQMWRVAEDGTQMPSVPGVGVVCGYTELVHDPRGRTLFFVPHLACLGGFESCRLGAYDCRDMLALPL